MGEGENDSRGNRFGEHYSEVASDFVSDFSSRHFSRNLFLEFGLDSVLRISFRIFPWNLFWIYPFMYIFWPRSKNEEEMEKI